MKQQHEEVTGGVAAITTAVAVASTLTSERDVPPEAKTTTGTSMVVARGSRRLPSIGPIK